MKFLHTFMNRNGFCCMLLSLSVTVGCNTKAGLDELKSVETELAGAVSNDFRFNGFTEYWHDVHEHRIRYGNLFRMNIPDQQTAILQAKVNLAEALEIPGLQMQEGFLNGLMAQPYTLLENATEQNIEQALQSGKNALLLTTNDQEVAKTLQSKYKASTIASDLFSHQANAEGFAVTDAFMLTNNKTTLFVVNASDKKYLDHFKTIWSATEKILSEYDLKRGWFGAQTLIKSVTCTPGTPIELMGKGMNEGNSWFVFDGYMEFLAKNEIDNWVNEVNLPVIADVGFSPMYGLENYDSLQVQSMFTPESWINYAKEKKGYVFRPVFDTMAERLKLKYDGYFATEGNIDQVNADDMPFVASTGSLKNGVTNSMIVFTKKNEPFTKAKLWEAIINKREVAILEEGKMAGPALYRNALQLLLLDRVYLEEYFGDRINLDAVTEANRVRVTVSNLYPHAVDGKITIRLPKQLTITGDTAQTINLAPNSSKEIVLDVQPAPDAMGRPNPVAIQYTWGNNSKSTVASVELPPAISMHELLYGNAAGTDYPVTISNFTKQTSFPVKLQVTDKTDSSKVVFEKEETFTAEQGKYSTKKFAVKIPAGNYTVRVDALGMQQTGQLGIEGAAGTASLKEVDLNNDGISEYSLENDQVKITLLSTGARVIEYIVKAKNDNILFKLWPEKPVDDRRPFRTREFYPYGGFEDFLGQPSIETHKVYDAEVVKKEGEYVQVKMKADYYGNLIEKIFTLYGNSPLLEIRFALTMRNPEMNMLGPQPILEIGKVHGPEDKFVIPEMDGLHEYKMRMDRYFGRAFFVKEGWNAGQDTKENIAFAGAFPVRQPIFLHMWMNHPSNPGSHYYYAEFQPWTPLFRNTTTYFSYYMWAAPGSWEESVKALRDRNLVTTR
ncbi:MAG: COG1470 family protein [Agriterribacter sp.]